MIYKYEGGGEIKIFGSAKQWRKLYYYHKYDSFAVAHYKKKDVAYVKSKSIMGILEKVVIEKVYIKNTTKTFYKNVNFYEDKFKSLYREDELITLEEAQVDLENARKIIEENRERSFCEKQTVKIQTFEPNNSVPVGSLWCSKTYAQKGEIVKILVKRILNNNIIEDKLGSLYQNNDLITVEEGKSIALVYWQNRREDIIDIINTSNSDNQ